MEKWEKISLELKHIFNEQDLGVVINIDLSFKNHIAEKIHKQTQLFAFIKALTSKAIPTTIRDVYTGNIGICSNFFVSNS